jgi:hypothetical protein
LVELKSSAEMAHIRMAVGQLFDYWFCINGKTEPCVVIMLPSVPDDDATQKLLEWLEIGLLWFSGEKLATCSDWLKILTG